MKGKFDGLSELYYNNMLMQKDNKLTLPLSEETKYVIALLTRSLSALSNNTGGTQKDTTLDNIKSITKHSFYRTEEFDKHFEEVFKYATPYLIRTVDEDSGKTVGYSK